MGKCLNKEILLQVRFNYNLIKNKQINLKLNLVIKTNIFCSFLNFLLFFFFPAFDSLIFNLPDLILDTPEAPAILGNFLARAIADDCIPPKLIQVLREKAEEKGSDLAKYVKIFRKISII